MFTVSKNIVLKNGKFFASTDNAKDAEIILNALLGKQRNEGQRRCMANNDLAVLLKQNYWNNLPLVQIQETLGKHGFALEGFVWEPAGEMRAERCHAQVGDATWLTLVATPMESGKTELVGYLS
jgi:hypothetical protein